MKASELINEIQKLINNVGDNYIYVCSPVESGWVKGFDINNIGLDADDSIVIDVK